ncbi:MAG: hypothetical protein HOV79_12190 [Hamadaea sp.]|nr:hypothetical protein [Hamadaea sp.]
MRTRLLPARLLPPARRNAVLTGVATGGVAVLVLAVLAVLGLRPNDPAPAPTRPREAAPSLRTALLDGPDLPASFTPSPTPQRVRPARRTESCQRLVAAPDELLRWLVKQPASGPSPQPLTARHVGADSGVLDQAVMVFHRGGATAAVDAIRTTAKNCRAFTARLDDGTKAQVKLTSTNVESLLIGDAYTVRMSLSTKAGVLSGYLAVARVGETVSVLRRTGPVTADPAGLDHQIHDIVDKALDKLVGVAASGLPLQPPR